MLLARSLSLFLAAGLALAPGESFEALVARWEGTEDAEARVGLLDSIAQAGRNEGLADGVVVGALAHGLADESFDVRGRAADLVAGLDPRSTLRVTVLRSAVKDLNDRHQELVEILEEAADDVPKRKKQRKIGEDMTDEMNAYTKARSVDSSVSVLARPHHQPGSKSAINGWGALLVDIGSAPMPIHRRNFAECRSIESVRAVDEV